MFEGRRLEQSWASASEDEGSTSQRSKTRSVGRVRLEFATATEPRTANMLQDPRRFVLAACLTVLASCAGTQVHEQGLDLTSETVYDLVLTSEVQWDQLNPARGAESPQAGTLWGNRSGIVPTGFLFKPVDGFESPPHIHNVTYRGVVIRGLVHNDDPDAEPMWMPAQSFWTQPKGSVHITAATGTDTLAYIEIDQGPYLVMPADEKFLVPEQPVNVHEANLVWVGDSPDVPASVELTDQVEISYLWEDRGRSQLSGSLIKVPAGRSLSLSSGGPIFRAVVIQGNPHYRARGQGASVPLTPGSYFASNQSSASHELASNGTETILYVRASSGVQLEGSL